MHRHPQPQMHRGAYAPSRRRWLPLTCALLHLSPEARPTTGAGFGKETKPRLVASCWKAGAARFHRERMRFAGYFRTTIETHLRNQNCRRSRSLSHSSASSRRRLLIKSPLSLSAWIISGKIRGNQVCTRIASRALAEHGRPMSTDPTGCHGSGETAKARLSC